MGTCRIDTQGCLTLPQTLAREIGARPLDVVSGSGRHLLLCAEGEPEVLLAGRVGEIAVADLLSFFNMFRKTGILSFDLDGGTKEIYFDMGEVVCAASTFPQEDLGDILLAQGKVSRDLLQKARQLAARPVLLGKLLIEKKIVSAKDIWLATRQQVEEIIYHLFTFHEGSFFFLHRAISDEKILRLSLSTQNLIMEGLRRIDERALFMGRIRSLGAIPVVVGSAEGLGAPEKRILGLVRKGDADVREVLRRAGVGEFEGLRLLYTLAERGLLEFKEPSVSAEGRLGEILALYNESLVVLCRRISERNSAFRETIHFFLRDLPQPFSYVFRDVTLREDGTIDDERILANLAGLEEGDKEKLLADGLAELVYMECHLARKELGTAGSAELLAQVQDVSRRVRELIGRKG